MAIRAPDFAFGDLSAKPLVRRASVDQPIDLSGLVPQMIEVQHAEVGFAAVDAWMFCQVSRNERRGSPSSDNVVGANACDVLGAVQRVPNP
jgi:hypothetical protein